MSSEVIKKTVKRERPCQLNYFKNDIKLLTRCGSGYSFTSSHASNHFGVGFFMFLMLYKRRKGIGYLFLFWASLIALSQVYVGVHFPLDILAGALLGMVVAGFMYLLYQKLYARTYLDGKYD